MAVQYKQSQLKDEMPTLTFYTTYNLLYLSITVAS